MRVKVVAVSLVMAVTGLAVQSQEDAARMSPPRGVSPGGNDQPLLIGSTCPTFSWSLGDVQGGQLEVAVYRLDGRTQQRPELVFEVEIAAPATSWTPDASRCLADAGEYAWTIRHSDGQATSEWARPMLFQVQSTVRSEVETMVQEILGRDLVVDNETSRLDVPAAVQRPRSAGGAGETAAPVGGVSGLSAQPTEATTEAHGVKGSTTSVGTGSSGVVGEATASSGETAGGRFVGNSPDGTSLLLESSAGGDLVRGSSSSVDVISVDATGAVLANAFILDCSSPEAFFQDLDGDSFGMLAATACVQPVGFITTGGDCDDTDANVNPDATEVCDDGIDNDCNGQVDEFDIACCPDADMDTYQSDACGGADCDDSDPDINPGAAEVCDGVDNDCDLVVDDVVCPDDGNACTDDTCGGVEGCVYVPVSNGQPCDDGDLCTFADDCTDGVCTGSLTDCNDGVACTDDACNPGNGNCTNTPNSSNCGAGETCCAIQDCADLTSDPANCGSCGNVCGGGDICNAGVCGPP